MSVKVLHGFGQGLGDRILVGGGLLPCRAGEGFDSRGDERWEGFDGVDDAFGTGVAIEDYK